MKYIFRYENYRQWRRKFEHLGDHTLDVLENFENMKRFDGMDRNEMMMKGKIVLKEWCEQYDVQKQRNIQSINIPDKRRMG